MVPPAPAGAGLVIVAPAVFLVFGMLEPTPVVWDFGACRVMRAVWIGCFFPRWAVRVMRCGFCALACRCFCAAVPFIVLAGGVLCMVLLGAVLCIWVAGAVLGCGLVVCA